MDRRTSDREDLRVLVFAPTGRDAALACGVLEGSGIEAAPCEDLDDLRLDLLEGAGAILITEEALNPGVIDELRELLSQQLPWSDLPVLVFAGRDVAGESVAFAVRQLGSFANVVLLDRPTRKVTLVSAVRSALRARRRQYEVRDLLLQLQQGVRDRDKFLAMLGHELRNPLGAILTTVELLERKSMGSSARELAVIHRQTRLLARLVDDLLDVTRVTTGKIALDRVAVDLRELIERCVQSQAVTARARRVELSLSAAESVTAMGDALRLEQVVNNLLTNALKYTPSGGSVGISLKRDQDRAEIRVTDTGVGIDPAILPQVFELFTQAQGTLDRSEGGLGIGLTLVRSLVRLHGGTVRAESAGPGHGSCFVVTLPAAGGTIASEKPLRELPAAFRPRRILLVEDNDDVRESLKELLEECGHQVRTAADGLDAIETAIAYQPEIALVDIGLPGLDGYAVAERLRQTLGSDARLVALTGYGLPEDRNRALTAGFDAHLTKPVHWKAIVDLLAEESPSAASPERGLDADADQATLRSSSGQARRSD